MYRDQSLCTVNAVSVHMCLLGVECVPTWPLMMMKYIVNGGGYFSRLVVVVKAVVYGVLSQLCACAGVCLIGPP